MRTCLLVLLLCSAGVVSAGAQAIVQEPDSVSGQVVDASGAAVGGASVVVKSKSTGLTYPTQTDTTGHYSVVNVPEGATSITVTVPGLAAVKKDVTVKAGRSVKVGTIRLAAPAPAMAVAPPTPMGDPVEPELAQAVPPPQNDVTPGPVRAMPPQDEDKNGVYGNAATNFVTVSANAVAGPMGYVSTPSMGSATQARTAEEQAFAASQKFNYPSIIFYVSAVPLVNVTSSSDPDQIQAVQETNRNPLWLDASFTLTFFDRNNTLIPSACTDGRVQVLGLLPQQTVAALKNRTAANVATDITDAAGAIASVYPGASTGATAATSALNVVFQNIFPPQPVAYEYSNMNGNCNFGWYFRPNTSSSGGASGEASILGIQTGIVLLKTSDDIVSIKVNGRSLSAWNKPPTSKSKQLFVAPDREIGTIKLPDLNNINYDDLTAPLTMFPSLIAKKVAMQILHIGTDAEFLAFAKANKLVGTDEAFDYVTNGSVSAFMTGGGKAPTDEGSGGTKGAPAPDAGKTGTKPVVKAETGWGKGKAGVTKAK
jgi:hypothetical protein